MTHDAHFVRAPSLRVCAWNAEGLTIRMRELQAAMIEYDCDIYLIGETWLRPGNRFSMPNYRIYRTDRLTGRGGGTAVVIKSKITHRHVLTPVRPFLEETTVEVELQGAGVVRISSVYASPSRTFLLDDYVDMFGCSVPTFLAGDLNAKHLVWGSRVINAFGRKLYPFVLDQNISVHSPFRPTFFRPGSPPDLLDIGLSKGLPFNVVTQSVTDISSDHDPVFYELEISPLISTSSLLRRVDWEMFSDRCKELSPAISEHICSTRSLEKAAIDLNNIIKESLEESTKLLSRPVTRGWLPPPN